MQPISPTAAPMRLSDLTAIISDTINQTFRARSFWVVAEVTDHSFRAEKNYHFFTLVEKHPETHAVLARVPSVAWGQGTNAITDFETVTGQKFTNDIQILASVTVQYHPTRGLQLVLHQVDSNFTLGALAREREATLARLVSENPGLIEKSGDFYITRNKRLSLNRVIQRIAVVCSTTSAGWQDFQHTLDNNPHGYRFFVQPYNTLVQGEAGAQQLVDRLVDIFQSNKSYDVVVIIRGGGAQTDFLIFDQYIIGRAVARFPIPVITGIGHQKNETVTDLMAHQATKTPTQAAELIINHNRAFEESLFTLRGQIVIRTQQRFNRAIQGVGQLQASLADRSRTILFDRNRRLLTASAALSARSRSIIEGEIKDMQYLAASIKTAGTSVLKSQRETLGHQVAMINALSPENTLKRGFAMVKVGNTITGDPAKISIGEDIDVILAEKTITATVKSKNDYHGNDFNI